MNTGRSFVDRIRDALEPRVVVAITDQRFKLKEKRVMTVKIKEVNDGTIVIDLDKLGSLGGIRGEHQSRCDYLILYQPNDSAIAVFVELKRTLRQEWKAAEQLRRSSPYLSYPAELSRVLDPIARPLPKISVRHVVIGSRIAPTLDKLRLGDPPTLPDETHRGIAVRKVVGDRVRFSTLLESS